MRFPKLSSFCLGTLMLGAVPATALANGIAENPVNTAPSATPSQQLAAYSCDKELENGGVKHVGQFLNGAYHEWLQRYDTATGGVSCIMLLKPSARDLSKTEAVALLSGTLTVSETISSGAERSMSFGPARSAESTATARLNTADTTEEAAILDLGFPRTETTNQAKSTDGVERMQTIGADDRQPVPDKTGYPWSLIGQLIVTWKDGTQDLCTGILMSPYVVLTAGQCVHNRTKGGFASKVSFAPGQAQQSPTGEIVRMQGSRFADYVETNNRWTQISGYDAVQTNNTRSDYAALYFSTPWTFATTYMPVVFGDTTTGAFNTAGYPTDFANAKAINQDMKYSAGAETPRSVNLLRAYQVREFAMDVSAGQNGSPIWSFDGTTRALTGIVSYGGDEVAGGVWFGAENQTIVNTFIQWSPSLPGPQNLTDDLRLPFVFSSGNTSTDSYLRFYNATPQGGSVRVTFYDEETGQSIGVWDSPAIPPFASKQFAVSIIEPAASPRIQPSKPNQRYTVGITANFPGYFQHVVWNRNGQSLTNLSGCDNGAADDAIHMSNVHSTLITAYPSLIIAHNIGAKAADAVVGVFESETGQRLGAVRIPAVPAGGSAVFQMRDIEAVLAIKPTPAAGPWHYNLVQEGDFPGYLQHMVSNTGAGVITNMTQKCAFAVR